MLWRACTFHHPGPEAALRSVVADTFHLVTDLLIHHLDDTPAKVFGTDVWDTLQYEAKTQKALEEVCRQSRASVVDVPEAMREIWDNLECDPCGSGLVRVKDGTEYPDIELVCDACGEDLATKEILLFELRRSYPFDWKDEVDGGVDPLIRCPECNEEAYVEEENQCMLCGVSVHRRECGLCGEIIEFDDLGEGGACGYCTHKMRD